ncbi:nucleotide-sugar transporter [Gonapodya prolifera JEL478]|uniref:Nucleotide-sugar transporter n=1 Tax=Gonapodya prolifera (strain JEL478) TaxID=1344416 RepID=A0A139B073_GONPJ|nr:nucleotide-sugar transporter [Gonapodya prolifera JEL478]|eukprot:KXS22391.1 nucleotide-sugar transporter [Gonapodya prolifera JEL478]
MQLKWISLLILVVQNSMLVIVMKYARNQPGHSFLSSTAVVMSEVFKLLVSSIIYYRDEQSARASHTPVRAHPLGFPPGFSLRKFWHELFGPESQWYKLTVPAVLYFVQNNLQYVAVGALDAATFQVTYQMKILTTALCSVLMLNRTLSSQKWISLVLLTVGIALVQLPPETFSSAPSKSQSHSSDPGKGLIAVTVACVLSGLAGVYFEKILKGSTASLWVRNVQLSLFTIIPGYLFGVLFMDGQKLRDGGGFFQAYTIWTWGAIATQALGGLVVAVVVKYADNILKGFATSISIILSSLASVYLFAFQMTPQFFGGAGMVIYATYLYGLPDDAKGPYNKVAGSERR